MVLIAEGKQAFARRQELREARVLSYYRATRREIARATVAEPPAPRDDVAALRDADLRQRALDEAAVSVRGGRDQARVDQLPSVGVESLQVLLLVGMDLHGDHEPLVHAPRESD